MCSGGPERGNVRQPQKSDVMRTRQRASTAPRWKNKPLTRKAQSAAQGWGYHMACANELQPTRAQVLLHNDRGLTCVANELARAQCNADLCYHQGQLRAAAECMQQQRPRPHRVAAHIVGGHSARFNVDQQIAPRVRHGPRAATQAQRLPLPSPKTAASSCGLQLRHPSASHTTRFPLPKKRSSDPQVQKTTLTWWSMP
jgi:hypothetical protein